MKTIKKLIIVLLLTLPMAVVADYLFKTLDARDGLTSSQINCIMKDSRGYVWFGTPAGLYRFDGYVFKNFQSDSQDGSSLPNSYINSVQETLDGNLLVETAAGYCVYHPQTESFERDMKQVFARMGIETIPSIVYVDRHKNLWGAIPNKGVVCYNMQQQLLYEFGYTDDAHGVPQGAICSISECKDGALIVYDDGRIVCCDVMHQQHTVWGTNEIAEKKLRRSKTLRAFADQMDNIWLYGQGTLFKYNKSANTWDTSISEQLGLTNVGVDRNINGMAGDRSGNIWIGSDQMGLLRYDINTHKVEPVQPINMNDRQMRHETVSIQSLYVDDTDLLWIGTEKSGIAYSGKYIYRFASLLNGDITALAQADSGKVWYGTSDNGVVGYEGPIASRKVSAMAFTPDGSLWIGSKRNGLTRIQNGKATIYSLAKDSIPTLIDDHINALCTDKVGNLWIATNGGLQVYNPRMNSFSSYTRENGKLNTNNVTALYYNKKDTKKNNLYIGTAEGLVVLNLSTTEKRVLTGNVAHTKQFTNNYITQICKDSRGLIWVGTREGLNVLNSNNDLNNDNLDYITEKQGLCNNNICGIAEDKNNNMWITTSSGVTRIVVNRSHEDGKFAYGLYNYTTADGLQSNEFNPGAILTRHDGNVEFGGLFGVNWMMKNGNSDIDALPRVMLTQLFLGEEEVLTGHEYDGKVLLTQALNESSKLELNHNQNTFTIKFAAGNYNQSERLQFMYWMEGLDDDWKNGNALAHGVTFRDLSSGKYTLHVKAVSTDGAVSNQERTLSISVASHWLLSWWMLLAYAIIILVALYFWRIGLKQLKAIRDRKRAVIKELKRQREAIKAASDDLRQPMARMTSIIGNLSEKEKDLEEREQLNALHSQMLQIITRVSDMQTELEHPEEKAKVSVHDRMELNAKGEIVLPDVPSETLTSEQTRSRAALDMPTMKFSVFMVDDNEDFLKFAMARLKYVYDFHAYVDIIKAATDIEELHPDLVVCKQNMEGMTGSELCNQLKMNPTSQNVKCILLTDKPLTPIDMRDQNITLSADDYLAKPFNLQEAIMRFNKVLGLGPIELDNDLIEGAETRMLENQSSSMTTATESYNDADTATALAEGSGETADDDPINIVDTKIVRPIQNAPAITETQMLAEEEPTLSDYSMLDIMDQQLMKNIEQYVMQNMSRGQISLEEMAAAMGMGRVPFFHRVRSLTGKTPAELIRDMRLKHACILLKRTNINMSELATNVGFMTAENFITIFREKFGMTPLEYRLKHR